MRLRWLHLAPYGRFGERVLDFGEARDGADVTVIYGPNEAGKSTTFAAWLDFLFGMPLQTPYSFRHARNTLRIGAEIEVGGVVETFWRTGTRQGSLTDDDGREVAQHRLDALLHGLGREAYRSRFSLDDTVLREGGEEILAAKGDLGEVLYAGTSGLSGLSAALSDMADGIDAVHRKGASKTVLAQGRKDLAALDEALKDARLDPRRYDDLREKSAAAAASFARAEEELAQARAAVTLGEAAQERAALWGEMAEAQALLSGMPDGPDLPAGAEARAAGLAEASRGGAAILAKAQAAREAAVAVLAEDAADPEGLRIAGEVAALDALRFEDAALVLLADEGWRSLPRLEGELADKRTALAGLVATVAPEGTAPDVAALPDDGIEALDGALKLWRGLRGERDAARGERDDARGRVGEAVPAPDTPDALRAAREAWKDARRGDALALREAATAATAAATRAAAGLPRDWRALAGAVDGLPEEETVVAAAQAIARAEEAVETAGRDLADADAECAALCDARDALAGRDDHVDDAALAEGRRARDAAWAVHRAALDGQTADAFAGAMRADDAARQAHGEGTAIRERVLQAGEAVVKAEGLADRRRDALDGAEKTAESSRARAAPLAAALGLDSDAPPAAMRPRLSALRDALRAALDAEETGRQAKDAEAALAAAEAGLRAALGPDAPDDRSLLEAAAEARDHALEAARRAHADRCKAVEEADGRAATLAEKEAALGRAEEAVRAVVAGSPFDERDAAALDGMQATLRKIAQEAGRVAGERHKAERLRKACDTFESAAVRLRAMMETPDEPPVALLDAAREWAKAATAARTRIDAATETRAAADRDIAEARAGIDAAEAERAGLLDGQDAHGADPDALIARLLERDALRARMAALHGQVDALAAGHDPAALAQEEAALTPGRAAMLADRVRMAEAARDEAVAARTLANKAEADAQAGQGGAAIDQERAALLAELREAARAAAARMIGLRAARAGLDRLRRSRRGPMLERTQAAFIRMTGGEWTALETRPEGTGERLVARRGEEIVAAEGMSQGTRAQLYLSLRLAGYGMFCAEHGALPFVTDDVLETFDDTRAAAALDLTAELGRQGQAIFLTHHRHLADMARERIEGCRVLSLEDTG